MLNRQETESLRVRIEEIVGSENTDAVTALVNEQVNLVADTIANRVMGLINYRTPAYINTLGTHIPTSAPLINRSTVVAYTNAEHRS